MPWSQSKEHLLCWNSLPIVNPSAFFHSPHTILAGDVYLIDVYTRACEQILCVYKPNVFELFKLKSKYFLRIPTGNSVWPPQFRRKKWKNEKFELCVPGDKSKNGVWRKKGKWWAMSKNQKIVSLVKTQIIDKKPGAPALQP